MSDSGNHQYISGIAASPNAPVSVITVPFPAQGHLNQMLQFSCLLASYGLPVHYVTSAVHNRQVRHRINSLNPNEVSRLRFHDIPTPPFASPPPNRNAHAKFPSHLLPAWEATFTLRQPMTEYIRAVAAESRRVVVIYDTLSSAIVPDAKMIPNAELYAYNCISAIFQVKTISDISGKPLPPLPCLKKIPSIMKCTSEDFMQLIELQAEGLLHRSGAIYNTCRLIEPSYMEVLDREEEVEGNRKNWAIGPIFPAKQLTSIKKHFCLTWLDQQAPNSVIYITFGTTTSLSDEEIAELAMGLEQSQQKFLWVLRDADKSDIFDGQFRCGELPRGFYERVSGRGLVVWDWAPQLEILAHGSIGGFMSHCGWNSCMESITTGVPMAAWPMHSDQPANALLMTEVLKVGVLVQEWTMEMELVRASTVESAVRKLMALEEGREMRRRAVDLAATVELATEDGGVSRRELERFIAHITRGS